MHVHPRDVTRTPTHVMSNAWTNKYFFDRNSCVVSSLSPMITMRVCVTAVPVTKLFKVRRVVWTALVCVYYCSTYYKAVRVCVGG